MPTSNTLFASDIARPGPCPFCGCSATDYDYDTALDGWLVACDDHEECTARVHSTIGHEDAVARWNRRVPAAQ